MRRVMVITGRRADYIPSKTVIKAIDESDLELQLVVTGMHLLKRYGHTIDEIEKDGFKVSKKIEVEEDDNPKTNLYNFAKYIVGITDAVQELKPDFICVLTDLDYALAGAIVGLHSNIPVVHMYGGDVSGTIDDSIRHAITKIAHLHFTTTKTSAQRVIKMGEQEWRVHIAGVSGIKIDVDESRTEEVLKKYGLKPDEKYQILIQHPVVTELEDVENQIKQTMDAIKRLKIKTIIINPNADLGGQKIIDHISSFDEPYIQHYNNLPREDFLILYRNASALVGNSSSGVVESATYRLPVVNIGTRQFGRERARNVIDVDYDSKAIQDAITKATSKSFKDSISDVTNPYESKDSGKVVIDVLRTIPIDNRLIQKKTMY